MPPTTPRSYRVLIAEGNASQYATRFTALPAEAFPPADVAIEVVFSSLNYKDALAVTGRGKIVRRFPMVCGIDLAGRVVESRTEAFAAGDLVVAVGHGLGETLWGGFAERAHLPAGALSHLPPGLTLEQAMAIGTAGTTAMLSLMALEHQGVVPGGREVLVTGAGGGVGSIAVALLAGHGYTVAASTGRPQLGQYLRDLGAARIVDRADLARKGPPLAPARWAGAVDTVGGETLASVIAATDAYGAVAACGLAGGAVLETTVFPFILRNVSVLGINSLSPPERLRAQAWQRLANPSFLRTLAAITTIQPLSEIHDLSARILAGQIRGRVVLDVSS